MRALSDDETRPRKMPRPACVESFIMKYDGVVVNQCTSCLVSEYFERPMCLKQLTEYVWNYFCDYLVVGRDVRSLFLFNSFELNNFHIKKTFGVATIL